MRTVLGCRAGATSPAVSLVALLLLTVSPVLSVEPAPLRPELGTWQVLSGKGEVSAAEGTMTGKVAEGGEMQLVSGSFPVQPDTIYRVKYQLRREQDLRVYARLEETAGGQIGVLNGLASWPGYALPPPAFLDLYSYFASSPRATAERVNIQVWPGQNRQARELAFRGLELTPLGKVQYPPTTSASFLLNGDCEAADEKGVALYWQSWGGPAEARQIVRGVGRNGSSALSIKGYYLLSSPSFAPHTGRRYRLGAWFKGAGSVTFELRGHRGYEISAMGQGSPRFTPSPDEWQYFSMETVALPTQTSLSPMIGLHAAGDTAILVDDAALVELGADSLR